MKYNLKQRYPNYRSNSAKSAKKVGLGLLVGTSGLIGCLAVVLQLAFFLALVGGVIYFIVFACTHWLRW